MKFLADESCDFIIVRALRQQGYDVTTISEISPGIDDHSVINRAIHENRILLTEDKDFGQLVFASEIVPLGVIYLRFPARARKDMSKIIMELLKEHGKSLQGCFIVLQPGKIRIARIV